MPISIELQMDSENNKLIKAGLYCSFMAQNTINTQQNKTN